MMSAAMQQLIAMTVHEVLLESDADEMTEHQLRMEVSKRLGVNVSLPKHKASVSQATQSFLEEEERAQEDDEIPEFTDSGDLIVCYLSRNRKVTVGNFKGKTLVSMREYYKKDGKEHPSRKGISLTIDQWSILRNNVPAIEAAIKKMTPGSLGDCFIQIKISDSSHLKL